MGVMMKKMRYYWIGAVSAAAAGWFFMRTLVSLVEGWHDIALTSGPATAVLLAITYYSVKKYESEN
jgi:hypothetical protein